MEFLACTILIGCGATAVTDLWALARRRVMGIPLPNFALVGRWIALMPCGTFRHDSIAAAPRMRGERLIGWTAHYFIGMAFAALLLGIWGLDWIREPRLGPALIVGVGTVAAPIFLMQPAMGMRNAARLQSLLTHAIFGVGLYAAGRVTQFFFHS
jgi:hypothetical protein